MPRCFCRGVSETPDNSMPQRIANLVFIFRIMALLHKNVKTNATKSRQACLFCMRRSHSKGGNGTLCTLVTFGRLPIKTWRNCGHGQMMGNGGERRTFKVVDMTVLLQTDDLSEPRSGFLWDCFSRLFSSRISS